MVRLRVGEWGPCQPSPTTPNDPFEEDPNDITEDNSNSFSDNQEQDATFPEAEALDVDGGAGIGSSSDADSGSSTMRPSQVSVAWKDVDLPRVGRQERSLTCVHVNGTRLSLR